MAVCLKHVVIACYSGPNHLALKLAYSLIYTSKLTRTFYVFENCIVYLSSTQYGVISTIWIQKIIKEKLIKFYKDFDL